MSSDRERDLTADEVSTAPEIAEVPEGARTLETHSYGTYDGTRFDGLDPSALYDCFFLCRQTFDEVSRWLEDRLMRLGWPEGEVVDHPRAPWRRWSRSKEGVELFDFTKSDWTHFPPPPAGWSMLRINYWRKPAREFVSEAEHLAWFNDGPGKGERWRDRPS